MLTTIAVAVITLIAGFALRGLFVQDSEAETPIEGVNKKEVKAFKKSFMEAVEGYVLWLNKRWEEAIAYSKELIAEGVALEKEYADYQQQAQEYIAALEAKHQDELRQAYIMAVKDTVELFDGAVENDYSVLDSDKVAVGYINGLTVSPSAYLGQKRVEAKRKKEQQINPANRRPAVKYTNEEPPAGDYNNY